MHRDIPYSAPGIDLAHEVSSSNLTLISLCTLPTPRHYSTLPTKDLLDPPDFVCCPVGDSFLERHPADAGVAERVKRWEKGSGIPLLLLKLPISVLVLMFLSPCAVVLPAPPVPARCACGYGIVLPRHQRVAACKG